MPRKSSIVQLPKEARELLDRLIREGRYTIDELQARVTQKLREIREEGDVSRSAVGRYRKSAEKQMEQYRQAQEIAKTWIAKIGDEPEGDVGKLLIEMLRTVAWQGLGQLSEKDTVKPADVMFLAKAIKDATSADKLHVERIVKIQKEVLAKAADAVEEQARAQGMDDKQAKLWREKVLGVA